MMFERRRLADRINILKLTKVLGLTALTFAVSFVLASPLSFSAMSLFSTPEKADFTISDFYQQVADHRSVRTLDPDIVIVDIGSLDRQGIASLLDLVADSGPRAVGIDITFLEPLDSAVDADLVESIRMLDRPVMASAVGESGEGGFEDEEHSFFIGSIPGAKEGVVNFPIMKEKGTVREFRPLFRMKDGGGAVPSFASALAERVDPEAASRLYSRGNEMEIIDFPSREFVKLTPNDIAERQEEMKGKVVLVGAAGDIEDVHYTPLTSRMPGISMHAYVLSQILGGRYYTSTGKMFDWLLAFALCFCLIWLSLTVRPAVKGLVVRLLQLAIVYLAAQAGYSLFVSRMIVTNFSYVLLMLTFSLFVVDIWNGALAVSGSISSSIRRRSASRAKIC